MPVSKKKKRKGKRHPEPAKKKTAATPDLSELAGLMENMMPIEDSNYESVSVIPTVQDPGVHFRLFGRPAPYRIGHYPDEIPGRSVLPKTDGKLYFDLWMPLLSFANYARNNGGIVPRTDILLMDAVGLETNEGKLAAFEYLRTHNDLIDLFLQASPGLPADEREIVAGWKRAKRGKFVLAEYGTDGALLLDMAETAVYRVMGIQSSWGELVRNMREPFVVSATLLPFRKWIITNGLQQILHERVTVEGEEMVQQMVEEAKANGMIISSL